MRSPIWLPLWRALFLQRQMAPRCASTVVSSRPSANAALGAHWMQSNARTRQIWGTDAMSIDDYARWLSRVASAVAVIMVGWGLSVVLSQPVTGWFAASATIWMAVLLISAFWQLRGSFTSIAAITLATAVVSRLFSILRLNPPDSIEGLNPNDLDRLVATGPGVPGFEL